mmetsp:Transcript_34240/g.72049  ORF Transcript_34240/g.72049 Transcript_34240/m.72049 type:complete len:222 (+) Transcript_34240:939-1604(+)
MDCDGQNTIRESDGLPHQWYRWMDTRIGKKRTTPSTMAALSFFVLLRSARNFFAVSDFYPPRMDLPRGRFDRMSVGAPCHVGRFGKMVSSRTRPRVLPPLRWRGAFLSRIQPRPHHVRVLNTQGILPRSLSLLLRKWNPRIHENTPSFPVLLPFPSISSSLAVWPRRLDKLRPHPCLTNLHTPFFRHTASSYLVIRTCLLLQGLLLRRVLRIATRNYAGRP